LRERETEFDRRGVRITAIGLGDRNYAKFFREETGITFPLLIDEERQAYRAVGLGSASLLHLVRNDNAMARRRARASGHRQHKLGKNPFQLGGTFVFAPGNRDLYAHLSKTFGDNASITELLEVIQ
jgi:hypothetical protein